jgi:tRNA pseudouridine55 synthase
VPSISFRLSQQPGRYSALKIGGKPLYEYAREGIPLPRPIEARPVRVDHIALTSFTPSVPISGLGNKLPDSGHQYGFPAKRLSVQQQVERLKVLRLVNQDQESARVQEAQLPIEPEPLPVLPISPDHVTQPPQPSEGSSENHNVKADEKGLEIEEIPPVFELEMTVSSGTYVRSIVHDLAISVRSAAHVVSLTRTRQGPFVSPSYTTRAHENVTRSIVDAVTEETRLLDCVDWAVLEDALRKLEAGEEIAVDVDGWANWELEILRKWPDQSGLKIDSSK